MLFSEGEKSCIKNVLFGLSPPLNEQVWQSFTFSVWDGTSQFGLAPIFGPFSKLVKKIGWKSVI